MNRMRLVQGGLAALATAIAGQAWAEPVARPGPISGRIIAKRVGETALLVPSPQYRPVEVRQDLKAGDVLRTNATGTLAVIFADRTQLRLGPNAVLAVKQVQRGSPASLQLQRGSLWARSPRGSSRLSVETPSATAAIRGTEYSIAVEEERTSLTVVEGVVDLFNPQGRIAVSEGQSAVAPLGEAPTRIFTVNPEARQQMLYYLPLEEGLGFLRPAPQPQREARAEVARVRALAPAGRNAEDWLSFAENAAEIEPRAQVTEALQKARALGLGPAGEARALLVDAGYAARDRQFVHALSLYERAYPALRGRQREVARYGIFITRILADPEAAPTEPPELNPSLSVSYVGQAFLAAFLGDFARADSLVAEGLRLHPGESSLHAIKGGLGVLTGREGAISEAARAALAVDPEDPFALAMQAEVELEYKGRPDTAIRYTRDAVRLAPSDDTYWNSYARALIQRERSREAEQAFRAGIAENPASFILRGNYALFLLLEGRLPEGRVQLEIAKGLDADNALSHLLDALLDLTLGKRDAALESALAVSAANPAYSEALLVLSEIYYARGEEALALQQVDAADRSDPNNPFVPLYRAAFAIDRYEADEAIVAAREALRRYRARGGIYASLSESRGSGSYIAGAFRFLNLEDWARYYGDRTFDPFVPATFYDRALAQRPSPYLFEQEYQTFNAQAGGQSAALADIFQGLRLDPLSIAGSERELHLTRQQFVEFTATPSLLVSGGNATFSQSAGVSGTAYTPAPFSFAVTGGRSRIEGPVGRNNARKDDTLTAFVGAELSSHENLVLFGSYSRNLLQLPGSKAKPRDNGAVLAEGGTVIGLYAHQFGAENVLTLAGGLTDFSRRLRRRDSVRFGQFPLLLNLIYSDELRSEGWFGNVNYALGLGALELHAGLEHLSARLPQQQEQTIEVPGVGSETEFLRGRSRTDQHRYYFDARFLPKDWLILQAQLGGARVSADGKGDTNFDLSIGAAVEPAPGHWLRAAYADATPLDLPLTLAPTAVVGLRGNEAPAASGPSRSVTARWDAEWTPNIFTAIEYQHQKLDGLSFVRPDLVQPFEDLALNPTLGVGAISVGKSKLDRVSVSGNFWLTGNVGITAIYAYSDSQVLEGSGAGRAIPFLSRHFARGAISWTHPNRIKVNGVVTYAGPRLTELNPGRTSGDLIGDLELEWQLLDKRVQVNAGLYNLFDEEVELIRGVPGFGRTLAVAVEVRF